MQDEAALALILKLSFTQPTTNLSVPALTISTTATDYGLTAQVFSLVFCIRVNTKMNSKLHYNEHLVKSTHIATWGFSVFRLLSNLEQRIL